MWAQFDFLGVIITVWEWLIMAILAICSVGIAVGLVWLVVLLIVYAFRWIIDTLFFWRRPKQTYVPATPRPDPYRSGAALNPFEETNAHGSGGLATAAPLHSSLNGSAMNGPPPRFEE